MTITQNSIPPSTQAVLKLRELVIQHVEAQEEALHLEEKYDLARSKANKLMGEVDRAGRDLIAAIKAEAING
jgi:hypothetical protein